MNFKILAIIAGVIILATAIFSTLSIGEGNLSSNSEKNSRSESYLRQHSLQLELKKDKVETSLPQTEPSSSSACFTSAELKEMAGKINIDYGIREDILRFIEKEIPINNTGAKRAAIVYAKKSQLIYYHTTQEEALKIENQRSLTLNCLSYLLPENWIDISRGIEKLMRNTPARDKRMWDIDERYFGWKVIGTEPMLQEELKEICETGKF